MRKSHVPIPEPNSRFQNVKCGACSEKQVVYSHASTQVFCNSCGNILSEPTGALAKINGEVLDGSE